MAIDFLILGGGIAGASAGYFLAEHGKVVLLEKEDVPGYHSTGRSAALYTENYGNAAIRALTVASGRFFRAPPAGFAEHPLLLPRGAMVIAPSGAGARFATALAEGRRFAPDLRELDREEALRLCPALKREWLGFAHYEPEAMDMDAHAIHQGFLRGLRRRGGVVVTGAVTERIERRGDGWTVITAAERFDAPLLVNAAGAWADEVAMMAGVRPVGIAPKRRTAFIIEPPADCDIAGWPMVIDVDETFYFKPESGQLLVSPADETPMPACDVQPDEMDIAVAAARLEAATRITVRRISRKWAGLRSFARDKTPVVGPAADAPSFIWLAGQGGYGIMTSPGMGRAAAALATGAPLPADLVELGLRERDLLPDRFSAPDAA